jgi:hypothetical protein
VHNVLATLRSSGDEQHFVDKRGTQEDTNSCPLCALLIKIPL